MSIINNLKSNCFKIITYLEIFFPSIDRVLLLRSYPNFDDKINDSIFLLTSRFLYTNPYQKLLVNVRGSLKMFFDSTSGRCTKFLFILDSGDEYELSYETIKFFNEYLSLPQNKETFPFIKKEIYSSPYVMNDLNNLNIFLQNAYDNMMQQPFLQTKPSQQQYFYSDPKGPMNTMGPG